MSIIVPDPSLRPNVESLESFDGDVSVFGFEPTGRRYGGYTSEADYENDLEGLIALAGRILADVPDTICISMDPYGARWVEWLFPMWEWKAGQPVSDEWDPGIIRYAKLFESGSIGTTYAGACSAQELEKPLRLCADMVMKNLATSSWLFERQHALSFLFFHGTMSLGVHILSPRERKRAKGWAEELGLMLCEVIRHRSGT